MVKSKSFEEFYYTKTDENHFIEEVVDYAIANQGDYSPYEGFMRCPECEMADLFLVSKSSSARTHLKKKPTSDHREGCSYMYEYASKKLIEKYVENLNYDKVQDKLDSMMRMLFKNTHRQSRQQDHNQKTTKEEQNPMLIHGDKKELQEVKAIRRKSLTSWIDASDGTDIRLLYGKVKLEVTEKEAVNKKGKKFTYYLLKLWTENKLGEWKYRTQIYRGSNKDDVEFDKVYQIAVIGKLNFKWKWWQIDLVDPSAVRIREV